jgi:hypothetical protein
MKLLKPTTSMVVGDRKTVYEDPAKVSAFFGAFRTYGGTENLSNDVYTVFDTAQVTTWYNPEIKQDCHIYLCQTEEEYRIITPPENINMRGQFMQFKVEKVGGKP